MKVNVDLVRAVAQDAYGEERDDFFHEVRVADDQPVEEVDEGFWVMAKLWVPREWVEAQTEKEES